MTTNPIAPSTVQHIPEAPIWAARPLEPILPTTMAPIEANPAEGKISVDAPVGRALAGQKAGARVEVEAPLGRMSLELVAVDAGAGERFASAGS